MLVCNITRVLCGQIVGGGWLILEFILDNQYQFPLNLMEWISFQVHYK